jgi:hypothetical protein
MAYRSSYRRSSAPRQARWLELRYAGVCQAGQHAMAAGERGFYSPAARAVLSCADLEHAEAAGLTHEVWQGSPTSGSYVKTLSDHPITRSDQTVYARFDRRGGYGRCEDAPCCGCCD